MATSRIRASPRWRTIWGRREVRCAALRSPSPLCVLAVLLVPRSAWAHKPSDAYLTLTVQPAKGGASSIDGRLDLAPARSRSRHRARHRRRRLDHLDRGARPGGRAIESYALAHLTVTLGASACALRGQLPARPGDFSLVNHSDGTYAVLALRGRLPRRHRRPPGARRRLRALLRRRSAAPRHRPPRRRRHHPLGHLRRRLAPAALRSRALSRPARSSARPSRTACATSSRGSTTSSSSSRCSLPSVVRRENGVWRPVPSFKVALLDVLKHRHRLHPGALDHPVALDARASSACPAGWSSRPSPPRSSSPR